MKSSDTIRFAGKTFLRLVISLTAFIPIWVAAFDLHKGTIPILLAYGFLILALVAAARYSKRENRRRKCWLSIVFALPFALFALLSLPAVAEGIVSPFGFWLALAVVTAISSFVADSLLPRPIQNEN